MVEKLYSLDGCVRFRYRVMELSSMAIRNPIMVTSRAASFMYVGIVICGVASGVMFVEIKNPAKMLPIARRLIELIRGVLFSLMEMVGGKRGWPIRA